MPETATVWGNEAPPAILSIFLGKQLSSILDEIARQISSSKMTSEEKTTLKLGIGRIPEILLDTTDRNRTSPFAFTGNRFEFRAAGSSANCAAAMIAINAAMANQLNEFKVSIDKLMEEGVGKDEAIFRIMKETIIASEPIRFEVTATRTMEAGSRPPWADQHLPRSRSPDALHG